MIPRWSFSSFNMASRALVPASKATKGLLLLSLASAGWPLAAQQPSAPRFEVASIRQNVSGSGSYSVNYKGETFTTTNVPLVVLLPVAYEITAPQVFGGPDWVRSDRFDIVAKMPADAKPDQMARMVRTLLEDRFKLRLRNEKREMAIFELALANTDGRVGPNLQDCSKIKGRTAEQDIYGTTGG
jgi:uncharacterized protein (TIGR03435 family)